MRTGGKDSTSVIVMSIGMTVMTGGRGEQCIENRKWENKCICGNKEERERERERERESKVKSSQKSSN